MKSVNKKFAWVVISIVIFFAGWGLTLASPVIGRSIMFVGIMLFSFLLFLMARQDIDNDKKNES